MHCVTSILILKYNKDNADHTWSNKKVMGTNEGK